MFVPNLGLPASTAFANAKLKLRNMKKIVCNVAFAVLVLNLVTCNAWCSVTPPPAPVPDAASTTALLGIAGFGLMAVRKFLR